MRSLIGLAAFAGLVACGSAEAGVDGVVTADTAAVTFKTIVYNYSGDEISGALGSDAFGSGADFASTSAVEPGRVSFQNGNASGGEYAFTSSQTDLNITFTNDTDQTVVPQLRSDIIPAGFGVYVGNACLGSLTNCPESRGASFQSFSPAGTSNQLAGASIDFKILDDGVTLYDLTASIDLVYDPVTRQNVFVDNIAQAQSTLNGFGLETTPGSQTGYGFNWNATAIDVNFPDGLQLLPDQSGTLTYQTTVNSYSNASCNQTANLSAGGCLIAYSAFGDPIGGSPGIKPGVSVMGFMADADDDALIDMLSYDTFSFDFPTFKDGVLTYILAPVPEPGAWLMLIFGSGLIGVALRRRAKSSHKDVTLAVS